MLITYFLFEIAIFFDDLYLPINIYWQPLISPKAYVENSSAHLGYFIEISQLFRGMCRHYP